MQVINLHRCQELHYPVGFIQVKLPNPEQAATVTDDVAEHCFQCNREFFQGCL